MDWYRSKRADRQFFKKVVFVGGYSHGTNVAGIIRANNDFGRLLPIRHISNDLKSLSDRAAAYSGFKNMSKTRGEALDLREFKLFLTNKAIGDAIELKKVAEYSNKMNVRIVNCSFGTGYKKAARAVYQIFLKVYKKEPSTNQLKELTDHFIEENIRLGTIAKNSAPASLFVFAAGNDSSNNDTLADSPTNIKLNNCISVAATDGDRELAEFSNYGVAMVDVAAPG